MKLLPGDILIKKTKSGQSVWLSQRLITDVFNLSDKYLWKVRSLYKKSVYPAYRKHSFLPATGKAWRWGKQAGMFYYEYTAIPNRKPTYYRDMLGDIEKIVGDYQKQELDRYKEHLNAEFLNYITDHYEIYLPEYLFPHTARQQKDLAVACAVLEFAIVQRQKYPEKKTTHIYNEVCELIERHELKYLPKSPRKFGEKLKRYDNGEAITDIIRLPRAGNDNALMYVDEEVKSWVIQLRAMGQNYTNEYIIRKVSEMCRRTGKEVPSRRWFGMNILEKFETKYLTAVNRFGSNTRGSKMYEGYIPMKNALFAGDAWQVDATRFNLVSHQKDDGKQGFLYVVAVRDVHSGDVLGWHFDYKEDRWAVINAVKMAVLEAGYLPYELVFDRFPGHNTPEGKEFVQQLKNMRVKVTFTHKSTGKAQLERWFGTLQTVFMQESDYYYGQGVQSTRKYAHRSPEYLKKIRRDAHKMGFDFQKSVAEANKIITAYRETPYSYYSRKHKDINLSPKMMHAQSEKPNVIWPKPQTISLLFGHKKEITLSHSGLIKTEIYKTDYYFQVNDFEIIKKHPKVWIAYDLEDLSSVDLFIKHEHFYVFIGKATAFEQPQAYGPQAEFNKIAKAKKRIADIEKQRQEALKEAIGDETELLMGRFTDKQLKEATETQILQASGDDVVPEPAEQEQEQEIDTVSIAVNQY